MTFEDLGRVWREQETGAYRRQRVEDLSETLERAGGYTARWRRGLRRSAVLAVPILLFFVYGVFRAPTPLARVGAIMLASYSAVAVFWLASVGRTLPDASLPVLEAIRRELARLDGLEKYLRGTNWARAFYVLSAFVLGLGVARSAERLILLMLFMMTLELGLFRPKVKRARARTQALRTELESWLRGVEELELGN